MNPKLPNLWARLTANAERVGSCLLWKGSTRNGYGQINLRRNRLRYVHRMAWIAWHGKIPRSHRILHSCDTPRCFNPDHISPGTAKQNTADMLARGRLRGGWNYCHGPGEFGALYDQKNVRLLRQHGSDWGPPASQLSEALQARFGFDEEKAA